MASLLDGLKAAKEQLAKAQSHLIPVPEWGDGGTPTIVLQVKPIERGVITRATATLANAGRRSKDEAASAGAAHIVSAAVTKVIIGGEIKTDLAGVAEQLGIGEIGVDGFTAADVILALCIKPGDVDALAQKVTDLSGYGAEIATLDGDFEGE